MNKDIRFLNNTDLDEISRIHLAAFPRSALTQLGKEAVRRYYDWQLNGPHDAVNLGAWLDGRLAGFCFGGIFNGALGGFLQKNRTYLAWRILTHTWLLGNEMVRGRIQVAGRVFRRRPKVIRPVTQVGPPQRLFGILSIAVDPAFQGKRIGQTLMEVEEASARERGFKGMNLSVAVDNAQAIGFYEHTGWKRIFDMSGNWTGRMEKYFEQPSL